MAADPGCDLDQTNARPMPEDQDVLAQPQRGEVNSTLLVESVRSFHQPSADPPEQTAGPAESCVKRSCH